MHKEEVEVTVQVESEYAPVGGVVRGTLTVNSRKILPFLRIVAAVRGLESSFAGSEGNLPQFEEEMFYKEDCIVHEPKDPNDAIIPPNKPLVYPFEIRLDRGLPATIAYEEGFVVVAVPKNKKPLFIVSAPKDLFLWGTTQARWERKPPPVAVSAHKGKVNVVAKLEERAAWQMGEQLLLALEIENNSSTEVTQISVSLQQRCIALMKRFKNRELAVHYPVKAQFSVSIPPGGRFSETLGVPVPTWKECARIWPSSVGNKFANSHTVHVHVKDVKVALPVRIFDALVEKQQQQNAKDTQLVATTSGDRFKAPSMQMLARSASRQQLGTDRAKQRLKQEKEGKEEWREADPHQPEPAL